jgi:hypothetical protein
MGYRREKQLLVAEHNVILVEALVFALLPLDNF